MVVISNEKKMIEIDIYFEKEMKVAKGFHSI